MSGNAMLRGQEVAPDKARFEAVLEDVSRADVPAEVIGRYVRDDVGQPPYSFEISYDRAAIEEWRRYVVRAGLKTDGEKLYESDMMHPVLTGGAPDHVDLVMIRVDGDDVAMPNEWRARTPLPRPHQVAQTEGVSGASRPALKGLLTFGEDGPRFADCRSGRDYPVATEGDFDALEHAYLAAGQPGGPIMVSFEGAISEMPGKDADDYVPTVVVDRFVGVWPDQACEEALGAATLQNTEWRIIRLHGAEIASGDGRGERRLLLDGEEGRFNATVGCNQLVGMFEQEEESLRFGHAAATMMACPAPIDVWEVALARVLGETQRWRIEGETLELLDAKGKAIAAFEALYQY